MLLLHEYVRWLKLAWDCYLKSINKKLGMIPYGFERISGVVLGHNIKIMSAAVLPFGAQPLISA